MTIQPARHECHAYCPLQAEKPGIQPVLGNPHGSHVGQVVSSFQNIFRGSQLTWYYRPKRYCPVLVALEGSALWGNTLATALSHDQNRTIPFGLIVHTQVFSLLTTVLLLFFRRRGKLCECYLLYLFTMASFKTDDDISDISRKI